MISDGRSMTFPKIERFFGILTEFFKNAKGLASVLATVRPTEKVMNYALNITLIFITALALPVGAFVCDEVYGNPAQKALQRDHYGPLGLRWGKSPAEARSILNGKLTFVEEKQAEEAPYHTIDQVWSGNFGKLGTDRIFLRFYKGEFFYFAAYMDSRSTGAVSGMFYQIVERIRKVYGAPIRESKPPKVASNQSIHDNLPLTENRDGVLQLLWNESLQVSELNTWKLHDLHILTGMWRPLADWRFKNKVLLQTFVHRDLLADGNKAPPRVYWVIAKEDVFKAWRKEVHYSKIIEPQDF